MALHAVHFSPGVLEAPQAHLAFRAWHVLNHYSPAAPLLNESVGDVDITSAVRAGWNDRLHFHLFLLRRVQRVLPDHALEASHEDKDRLERAIQVLGESRHHEHVGRFLLAER
jgi:hypothetical protein